MNLFGVRVNGSPMTEKPDAKRARWIAVAVDIFEHPLLNDGRPFDRVSAWLWLCANAAWKRHAACVAGVTIELQRGQVLVGRDHLAATWRWKPKQVRTFLLGLERAGQLKMIGRNGNGRSKGRIANVATICNYEKYQTATEKKGRLRAGSGPVEGQTLPRTPGLQRAGPRARPGNVADARRQADARPIGQVLAQVKVTDPAMHEALAAMGAGVSGNKVP